jgi:hypothetical protein
MRCCYLHSFIFYISEWNLAVDCFVLVYGTGKEPVHAPPKTPMLKGQTARAPPALCVPPAAPEAEEVVEVSLAWLSAPAAAVPSVLLAVPAAALDAANAGEAICCAKIAAVAINIPAITNVAIIIFLIY